MVNLLHPGAWFSAIWFLGYHPCDSIESPLFFIRMFHFILLVRNLSHSTHKIRPQINQKNVTHPDTNELESIVDDLDLVALFSRSNWCYSPWCVELGPQDIGLEFTNILSAFIAILAQSNEISYDQVNEFSQRDQDCSSSLFQSNLLRNHILRFVSKGWKIYLFD